MLRIFWRCRFGIAGCSLYSYFSHSRFSWQCEGRHGVGIAITAQSYFVLEVISSRYASRRRYFLPSFFSHFFYFAREEVASKLKKARGRAQNSQLF